MRRYFRLRQLTNYMNSHMNAPPCNRNFYVQVGALCLEVSARVSSVACRVSSVYGFT